MQSCPNSDDSLNFDLVPVSIFSSQVSRVEFGLIVQVTHNRNHIRNVENLDVVTIS